MTQLARTLADEMKPMSPPRPAPKNIRFTSEHNALIDAALRKAKIQKSEYAWFPRLLVIVLKDYLSNAAQQNAGNCPRGGEHEFAPMTLNGVNWKTCRKCGGCR